MMVVAIALSVVALGVVVYATARSMVVARSEGSSLWRQFGLGLVLMLLFFATWLGQGIAEWQTFTDEAAEHQESTAVGDFVSEFAQSTLENWQSEFLQLFAFVTLSALFIHKGSAESKDSDDRMEASLQRIERHLGTFPSHVPKGSNSWELPDPSLAED